MENAQMTSTKFKPNWFRKTETPVVISGPCSAETEEQILETCRDIAATGFADILRAGIWKPRTRPGTFEGVGEVGLPWMVRAREETGMPITVEVAKASHVEACLEHDIDILWIGARTTVNPFAVQEIAEALKGVDIPILVKNPINPDLSLWLGAIERIEGVGIDKVGAIHRGFSHTSEKIYRNRPQWQLAIDFMTRRPETPMICDPSHICGNRHMLQEVAQKAVDLNYDGLMIETHRDPDTAWSDAKQQITPQRFGEMIDDMVLRCVHEGDDAVQRDLSFLRQSISEIDSDLYNLLGERMKIAREIGAFKKEHRLTIYQPKRWEETIQKANKQAEANEISVDFMTTFLRALHDESITQQERVMKDE